MLALLAEARLVVELERADAREVARALAGGALDLEAAEVVHAPATGVLASVGAR